MNLTDFKPGDRVRVVIEGVVRSLTDGYVLKFQNEFGNSSHEVYTNQNDITVERIEPPVEVFGPGTYVQHKRATDMKFLVLANGYVDLVNNLCWRDREDSFTSKDYDRIEMAEVPL